MLILIDYERIYKGKGCKKSINKLINKYIECFLKLYVCRTLREERDNTFIQSLLRTKLDKTMKWEEGAFNPLK